MQNNTCLMVYLISYTHKVMLDEQEKIMINIKFIDIMYVIDIYN